MVIGLSEQQQRADRLAYHAICSLRDGRPDPALLDASAPTADYGAWTETVASLALAYGAHGPQGFDGAYKLLLAGDPLLCGLMASFDDADGLVKQIWSVAQLYDTDFPQQRFVVPRILPTGLSILAGRPKLGKSWLALQIAGAVGGGGSVLGQTAAQGRQYVIDVCSR